MDAINSYLDGLATKLYNILTSCNAILSDAGFSTASTLYDLPSAIESPVSSLDSIDTLLGSGVVE